MTVVEEKTALRKEMLMKRVMIAKQSRLQHDEWICKSIWDIIEKNNYKNIHCYIPMGKEINILPLIEKLLAEKINVIAPKTLRKPKMQNLILKNTQELEKGVFGTSHPANSEEYVGDYDLIIVPGLAFDDNNFRLGYGGAYYDNFLVLHPNTFKLGIFYPVQKVMKVPIEPHDIQLNKILYNIDS